MNIVKNTLIVFNDKKPRINQIVAKLISILEKRNIASLIVPPAHLKLNNQEIISDFDARYKHKDYQLIFAVGGDGTFLYTARTFLPFDIPLVGINAGRLGFLMEIMPDKMESAVDKLLNGEINFAHRMMLNIKVRRKKKPIAEFFALNEVVISRGVMSRMVDIDVSVNNDHFSNYRADGVIVATATGSTAYNLSAGGPILTPTTEGFIITPICPHTLGVRPIIMDSNKELHLKVLTKDMEIDLTIDGQEKLCLKESDSITISKSKKSIQMYYFGDNNFYKTLREKLGWKK